jgi:uncharacterized protein with HEPN domain
MIRETSLWLADMASFAAEALALMDGRDRNDLETDRALELQLTLLVLRVGEAASHVPPAKRESLDLPWADVIAMRNRLIHAYFEIDHDLLWQEVEDVLPLVVRALRSAAKRR